ncbi:MAG: hypothetical protein U0271_17060 [Polyangiaceae bacterium]
MGRFTDVMTSAAGFGVGLLALTTLACGESAGAGAGGSGSTTGGSAQGGAGGAGGEPSAVTSTHSTSTGASMGGANGVGGAGGVEAPFVCDPPAEPGSLYERTAESLDINQVDPISMCKYRGDVLLIVNTAAA